MEHIEAHTMRLLGTVPAETMKSSAVHFQAGDVLYGRLRPYLNKVFRPHFEGLCSAEFIVLPENDRIEGAYLQYLLNSAAFVRYASRLNTGDRPRVDFDQLAAYTIGLPSRDEQQRIVAEIEKQFSRLDEAVANLKRVKANLKRYNASVLKAAVEGRLVPTEAELARKEGRTYETGEQLLARILKERRAAWEKQNIGGRNRKYYEPQPPDASNLPELPEGWAWATTEQISGFITKGTTPTASKLTNESGEVRFLKVYNLTYDGNLQYDYKPTFISRKTHEGELSRSIVRSGDVLINIVGPPLGQVSIVPEALQEANINQAIARFRPISPIKSRYLALVLLTKPIIDWAIRRAKTTAGQANLTLEICRNIPIPIPPTPEQNRIVAATEHSLSIAADVEAQVNANHHRAHGLRQAILGTVFRLEDSTQD
jgi:type I restriction enzyme S subunit